MTLSSTTRQHPPTDQTTEPTTTSRTTTTTEHYARQPNETPERRTTATRSKDSHRCITIRGCGPASGRPGAALAVLIPAVDLFKIMFGWSAC